MTMTEDSDARGGVQVIARAAAVLRALKNENEGLSLGQIAERVGLPRSTVQRIVGALQAEQFVIAASPGRGIRLGPQLASLAESARMDVVEKLRPFLQDLSRRTRETVDLAVVRGSRLIFLDQIIGNHRLRAVSQIGETFPLATTANGKAALILMSERRRLAIFEQEGIVAPGATLPPALLEELGEIERSRVAFDRDQHTDGISAVGAAFVDRQGDIYAISIPVPSGRFREQESELIDHLRVTMQQVERLEYVVS